MATLIFFQNFSISVAVVIANTLFTQSLISKIPLYAPSLSPAAVLAAGSGAYAVRHILPEGREGELGGLLRAYSESLRNVFYFLVGLAVVATGLGGGLGWRDVRRKKGGMGKGEGEGVV